MQRKGKRQKKQKHADQQSNNQAEPSNEEQAVTSHQHETGEQPTNISKQTKRDTRYWLGHSLLEWLTFGADLLIAVTATIGLYLIYRQLTAMEIQSRVMADQLAEARAPTRLDQRAWISMPETKGDPVVGREWKIDAAFANTGRTPALIDKMTLLADPIEKGKQPDFIYKRFFGSGTIPPNQTHWTRVIPSGMPGKPAPLTQEGFDLIASGAIVMYVHGRVDYSDVFGEKHWTTFCYFYRPKFGYGACDKNNDVDRPKKGQRQ